MWFWNIVVENNDVVWRKHCCGTQWFGVEEIYLLICSLQFTSLSHFFFLDWKMLVLCGGSYRRGKLLCSDMDFIITHPDGSRGCILPWFSYEVLLEVFYFVVNSIARYYSQHAAICLDVQSKSLKKCTWVWLLTVEIYFAKIHFIKEVKHFKYRIVIHFLCCSCMTRSALDLILA